MISWNGIIVSALILLTAAAASAAIAIRLRLASRAEENDPERHPQLRAREIRNRIVSDAVLLAAEVARVDGLIAPSEMDAIRDFINQNVKRADDTFTAQMMREGLERPTSMQETEQRLATIAEIGDRSQHEMVLDFLVYVARADGVFTSEEVAYLRRACSALGFTEEELREKIDGPT